MVTKPAGLDKSDAPLQEALRSARDDETLCAILLLDTGPQPPEPELSLTDFPSRQAWQQAIAQEATARVRDAVAGTLEGLHRLGLNPQGWELGQAVVRGSAAAITGALELPGVKFAVLDWELGLLDALTEPLDGSADPFAPASSGETAPQE